MNSTFFFITAFVCVVLFGNLAKASDKNIIGFKGREAEAVVRAVEEFKRQHVSTSGDLRNYSVEFKRRGKLAEITFIPDQSPLRKNEAGTGGGTAYGSDITYVVNLASLRIVRSYLYR